MKTYSHHDFMKYWSLQSVSFLKQDNEIFYEKKALEHIDFIREPDRNSFMIDLGCGAGELLFYLKKYCNIKEASDFSENILNKAAIRCESTDIKFIETDILNHTAMLKGDIWISSGSMNIYLTIDELYQVFHNFIQAKNVKSLYLFDTSDPDKRLLLEEGLTLYDRFKPNRKRILINSIKKFIMATTASYNNYIVSHGAVGYGFRPHFWLKVADDFNLEVEMVTSKYYEWRYHVALHKK